MDRKSSPELHSPDQPSAYPAFAAVDTNHRHSQSPTSQSPDDMATMVAHGHTPNMPGSVAGISKRYRPAPAKTFQCRGYGECRMVFSRSEHLARHIRKHTGERPFTCHCGKQFSRLDNLRQHAQTVHADKQEQNERMMRDLTSLHATMAAANKVGHTRGGRRSAANGNGNGNGNSSNGMGMIKQEDMSMPMHQRPGTSTGYEGDMLYQGPAWHVQTSDMDSPPSRSTNNHSFRDPGQSFLAPSSSSPAAAAAAAQSQSFLPFAAPLSLSLPDPARDARPGSRPTTAGAESQPRSLPPLAAVVPSAVAYPPHQSALLSFPGSLALRRPSTATRPGTAPASASFYSASAKQQHQLHQPAYNGGLGLVNRTDISLFAYGRFHGNSDLGQPTAHLGYDSDSPPSPVGQDSPFYFHPPDAAATAANQSPPAAAAAAISNPRKRAFAGPDGPYDDASPLARPLHESGGPAPTPASADYDYGSESRPQSRRLSVMELCNDPNATAGPGAFLLSAGDSLAPSRPGTSSGALVSSASALALVDRGGPGSPPLHSGAPPSSGGSAAGGQGGGGGGGAQEFGGGGVPKAFRRGVPSSPAATASSATASPPPPPATTTTTGTLFYSRGASSPFAHSAPLSGASPTPPATSPALASATPAPTASPASAAAFASYSPRNAPSFAARSPVLQSHAGAVSRRGQHGGSGSADGTNGGDQVRVSPVAAHAPAAVGMRV